MDKENLIDKLYKQHYKQLFIFGLQFDGEPNVVKDAINDVFLNLCEKPDYLHRSREPIAYLLVCLRNKILKGKKAVHKQHFFTDLPYETAIMPEADENAIKQQLEDLNWRVSEAVSRLTTRQREIIQLKYYEAKKTAEIEILTGMSTKTIYNTLSTALKSLKAEVKYGWATLISYLLF